jgi:hypothetical protein
VSIVARFIVAGPVGCMLISGLLTGCARGPGLSESAEQIHIDAHALLDDTAERLGPTGAHPRVIADATRDCESGRARKDFRGRVPLRSGPDTRVMLDQATDVSLTMIRARGYRLEHPPRVDGPRRRSFVMTRDMPPVRMTVRLRGGRQAYVELTATTPCLTPT